MQHEFSDFEDETQIRDEKKFVFIRKIELTLNGSPLDQVEDKQNKDECIQAYWRMFTFNGQMNSLFTNGIRPTLNNIFKKLFITIVYC